LSDGLVEIDEPGLIGFIERGERAGNPQPSANCFLPSGLLVHEQYFGMHLSCESDRLGFSQIKLRESQPVFRAKNFQPLGRIAGPVSNRYRCERVLQLCENGWWNQNYRVRRSIGSMRTR